MDKKKIIFFVISIIFSLFSNYYVNYRERNNKLEQLKDPIIDNLPYFKNLDYLYDLLSFPPLILLLINYDKIPINNLLLNVGLIYLLRGICVLTTSIPKLKTCDIKYNDKKIFFSGGCYDKIFSGHVAFIITFVLYNIYYTNQAKYKILYYFYILLTTILSFLTESHYSIDVIISWIISFSIFLSINKEKSINQLFI